MLAILTSACTHARDAAEAAPKPDTRSACEVALPAAWQRAFENGGLATGGSTTTQAVGPNGEVVAVRDNGPTRDLLLIGPDGSMTVKYTVPNPDGSDREFADITDVAMDDRRIVVGVTGRRVDTRPTIKDGQPYATTADPGSALRRIDVIDRTDDSVRTIVTGADPGSTGEALESLALHADTVYWQTGTGDGLGSAETIRSFDLNSGAVAEVASGELRQLRATPVGVTWTAKEEIVVRSLTSLPAALAAVPDINEAGSTLAGDGTHYAWITGISDGGTGIAWWSPDAGPTRVITGKLLTPNGASFHPRAVYVAWPYVVIGPPLAGRGAEVVDTRSGAITNVDEAVVAAGGGTVATRSAAPGVAPFIPGITGLVRTDALPPLTC